MDLNLEPKPRAGNTGFTSCSMSVSLNLIFFVKLYEFVYNNQYFQQWVDRYIFLVFFLNTITFTLSVYNNSNTYASTIAYKTLYKLYIQYIYIAILRLKNIKNKYKHVYYCFAINVIRFNLKGELHFFL